MASFKDMGCRVLRLPAVLGRFLTVLIASRSAKDKAKPGVADDDDGHLPPKMRAMLEEYLRDNPPPVYPDPMAPPWVQFPDIKGMMSMGWRMGPGEDYRHAFFDWFTELPSEKRYDYIKINPEPDDWSGYYDIIIERTKT